MYCESSNAVLQQSIPWNKDSNRNAKLIDSVMNKIFDFLKKSCEINLGINNGVVGYNNVKYEQWEELYSMAYTRMNSLEKNYVEAFAALNDIEHLEENWNGNGASPFSSKLIQRCKRIVKQLPAEPFVCPTACESIQFEYEKENGEYLEFEVYEDRIEVFWDTLSGDREDILTGKTATDRMKQMVVDFYG